MRSLHAASGALVHLVAGGSNARGGPPVFSGTRSRAARAVRRGALWPGHRGSAGRVSAPRVDGALLLVVRARQARRGVSGARVHARGGNGPASLPAGDTTRPSSGPARAPAYLCLTAPRPHEVPSGARTYAGTRGHARGRTRVCKGEDGLGG